MALEIKKKLVALTCLITLLTLPIVATAADPSPSDWFNGIVTRAIDQLVWPIFFSAMVVMFIWAGYLFVTAQGEPSKITNARKVLLWAIIGGVVGALAFAIYNLVKEIVA